MHGDANGIYIKPCSFGLPRSDHCVIVLTGMVGSQLQVIGFEHGVATWARFAGRWTPHAQLPVRQE
jgi:hypothetical protein